MSDISARLTVALADRYRIERELGQGGMATVYLALDLKHDRKVALKVLKPELAAVLGAERFVVEIKTTAALQHPHILPLFDSGTADGFLYYVMPYVEGETLRNKLDRETQLGIDEAVKITTEVADALDYAHRHGVIHRDIKPENILLHDGRPMVADFGIALAVSAAAGGRMTETGLSLGTPHYMSPEQATADKEITARSDVYSLASVLYEMLTGTPPHTGASAQQIIMKIVTEEAAPVTRLRKSVPPNVAAAVGKALERLPADRFESARAFAEALGNPGFTTARITPQAGGTATARGIGAWIRSPWSWAAIVVVAGLAAALFATGAAAPARVTFVPKSFRSEAIFVARFAPDGQTIVFNSTGETGTVSRLFVIRPDYPAAEPLGPDSTHLLSISSTGTLAVVTGAVYFGHRLFEGTLATLPLGGGAPREVLAHVRDADWAPDGNSMAIIRTVDNVDGLEYPIGTVLARTTGYLSDLRISPAGEHLAYFEHPAKWDDRGSVVIIDRTGRVIARSGTYWSVEGLAWQGDGSQVLFSGSEGTSGSYTALTVYSMDRRGRVRLGLSSAGGITLQDVARSGRWLVTRDDQPYRLFVGTIGSTDERELGWQDVSVSPQLSRDGKLLSFSDQGTTGGLNYAVMLRKADGSPAARLGEGQPLAFSSDGRSLLVMIQSTPPQLMSYPTGAGTPRRLDQGQFESLSYWDGALFADGKRYFACGSRANQGRRCWVGGLAGDSVRPVTPEGATQGILSADEQSVAAQVADTFRLYRVDGGPSRPARGLTPDDKLIRWSPDGRELWVWRSDPTVIRVDRVDPVSGRRSLLMAITPREHSGTRELGRLSLSDDARTYAYVQIRYTSFLYTVEGLP
ncbi:MAG TPA: protein kinase [Gemmatimonadales bacterium]|nr:protein kinase [Gemmatimonadales bacterium]